MTVVFGTLGFTPNKLLPTVRNHDGVTHLVFFHDHDSRGKVAATKVRDFCKDGGIKWTDVEVDAFDILECARRMLREVRKHARDEIVFNITGGTPVISSAATLVCILEGIRAVYIHEETKEEIGLPLLTVRYESILNPKQARVLAFIAQNGDTGCAQVDIGKALKLSASTVSHHVKNLKNQQLIRVETDPKDTRSERVFVMPSATILLERIA